MLETVAVSADLGEGMPPPSSGSWRSSVDGTTVRHALSARPPGVGYLSVAQSAGGTFLHCEVNLTALALGSDRTWMSLSEDQALQQLLLLPGRIAEWVPPNVSRWIPDDPEDFRVTRCDPSRTFVTDSPGDVVAAAFTNFSRIRGGRSAVSLHVSSGATATLRWNNARSWSVYDKSGEAESKGQEPPSGLLRCEARLRPRKLRSKEFIDWQPTLDWKDTDMARAREEVDALQQMATAFAGTAAAALAQSFIAAGVAPASAFRLAGYALASDAIGDKGVEAMGVGASSVRRWRSELRNALAGLELDPQFILREMLAEDERR